MRNASGHGIVMLLAAALVAVGIARPASADLDEAVQAWRGGLHAAAVAEFRRLAETGDPAAQRWLGLAYRDGKGVAPSAADAAFWLRAAADRGDADAQVAYGDMVFFGAGVTQDMAEAARWYRAAATGDSRATAGQPPALYVTLTSEAYALADLGAVAGDLVRQQLMALPGVADAAVVGAPLPVLRIAFDAARLAAYGLTPQDAQQALQGAGVAVGAARSTGAAAEFTLLWSRDQPPPEDLAALVLATVNGAAIRLADVAAIELGVEPAGVTARYQDRPVVAVRIEALPASGPLAVATAVCRALPAVRSAMPAGIDVDIADDTVVTIEPAP